jgi:hypothetical protein
MIALFFAKMLGIPWISTVTPYAPLLIISHRLLLSLSSDFSSYHPFDTLIHMSIPPLIGTFATIDSYLFCEARFPMDVEFRYYTTTISVQGIN